MESSRFLSSWIIICSRISSLSKLIFRFYFFKDISISKRRYHTQSCKNYWSFETNFFFLRVRNLLILSNIISFLYLHRFQAISSNNIYKQPNVFFVFSVRSKNKISSIPKHFTFSRKYIYIILPLYNYIFYIILYFIKIRLYNFNLILYDLKKKKKKKK